mmetsp:Transcript_112365/g.267865  ORF Transcript_112365/g.267865 Transcript_112365/m.267865 type:complete len:220 (-) Transcript_112365:281-940(-)
MLELGEAVGEFGARLALLAAAALGRLRVVLPRLGRRVFGRSGRANHRLVVPGGAAEQALALDVVAEGLEKLRQPLRLQLVHPNEVPLGVEGVGSLGHLLMELLYLPPLFLQGLFRLLGRALLVSAPRLLLGLRLAHALLLRVHGDFRVQGLDPGRLLCGLLPVEAGGRLRPASALVSAQLRSLAARLVGLGKPPNRKMHAGPAVHLATRWLLLNLPLIA